MKIIIGNIYSKIVTEPSDVGNPVRYVSKFMRIKLPGSRFIKSDTFDGFIRFVDKNGRFLTGFLSEVIKFAEDDFKVVLEDHREILNRDFNIAERVSNKDLWDYQAEGVKNCLTNTIFDIPFPRGIIEAATNSGKGLMIVSIAKTLGVRALIVVHRKNVYNELLKVLTEEFGTDLGTVENGFKKVNIVMVKTFINLFEQRAEVKSWAQGVGLIMCDESHRAEHLEVLKKIPAPYRFLFSGTHSEIRDPITKANMIGFSGPVLYRIRNRQLIDIGKSQRPIVKIYMNRVQHCRSIEYHHKYIGGIVRSEDRLQILSDYIEANPDKYVLIAVKLKEHAKLIGDFLEVPYIHGDSPNRDSIIESFTVGDIKVLVSTVILQEGSNLPLINTLFYMIGEYSEIAIKQFVGRAIRLDGVHSTVDIIDFYDQDYGVLRKHSRNRLKVYKKEGFEIKFMYDATPKGDPKKA